MWDVAACQAFAWGLHKYEVTSSCWQGMKITGICRSMLNWLKWR